ncbi:hypothetical protein ACOMHN_048239 [Nucella lapillus]
MVSHTTSWSVTPRHGQPHHVMVSHTTSWSVTPRHGQSHHVMVSHTTSRSVTPRHGQSHHVMVSHTTSRSVTRQAGVSQVKGLTVERTKDQIKHSHQQKGFLKERGKGNIQSKQNKPKLTVIP